MHALKLLPTVYIAGASTAPSTQTPAPAPNTTTPAHANPTPAAGTAQPTAPRQS